MNFQKIRKDRFFKTGPAIKEKEACFANEKGKPKLSIGS
jgi:hypothetical protein